MRRINTHGCTPATRRRPSSGVRAGVIGRWAAVLALAAATIAPSPAHAQPRPPSPDDTLKAFQAVDVWVRAWGVPDDVGPLPTCSGACVLLRGGGRTVGRGIAWADPSSALPRPLADAARAALADASAGLNVPNDATREDALRLVAQDLIASVELAGPIAPFEPATWEDAEADLRPGLDGVAVRIVPPPAPDGRTPEPGPLHAMFPSQMLLTGTLPHRGLAALCAKAIGDGGPAAALDEPAKIREKHAGRMYRFRVTHAAQPAPGKPAALLFRGQRLIPPGTATSAAELRLVADDLANALLSRRIPGAPETGDRAVGVRRLGSAEVTPADPVQHLLAAYALGSYRAWLRDSGALAPQRERELDEFTSGVAPEEELMPAGPAWSLLGKVTGAKPPVGRSFLLPGRYRACLMHTTYGTQPLDPPISEVEAKWRALVSLNDLPLEVRPVVVLATLRFVAPYQPTNGFDAARSDAVLRSLFAEAGPGRLVSLMPWLGWAEIAQSDVARRTQRSGGDAPDVLPGAVALRQMRDQLWQHQLSVTDAGEDVLDMAGGIVFTAGLREGRANPYPTWQCARPLAFVATMLGDRRLTEPQERPREIARLMQALRFLRQLQADDAMGWMAASPAELGGVRAATWDNTMPIDATSMTLLCVVETLKSLDAIAKEQPK